MIRCNPSVNRWERLQRYTSWRRRLIFGRDTEIIEGTFSRHLAECYAHTWNGWNGRSRVYSCSGTSWFFSPPTRTCHSPHRPQYVWDSSLRVYLLYPLHLDTCPSTSFLVTSSNLQTYAAGLPSRDPFRLFQQTLSRPSRRSVLKSDQP